jgi:predicted aldo/keto reductase-like oxidoreductase
MEPVKGGTLASLPARAEALMKEYAPDKSIASWAVRYAAGAEGVTVMLSGMSSLEQVKDNLKTFKPFEPLTDNEMKVIEGVLAELTKEATIPCTACGYCAADCPQQIAIPVCFALYNEVERKSASKFNRGVQYRAIPAGRRANDCTSCGTCVPLCPQHIDIPDRLKDVAGMF